MRTAIGESIKATQRLNDELGRIAPENLTASDWCGIRNRWIEQNRRIVELLTQTQRLIDAVNHGRDYPGSDNQAGDRASQSKA